MSVRSDDLDGGRGARLTLVELDGPFGPLPEEPEPFDLQQIEFLLNLARQVQSESVLDLDVALDTVALVYRFSSLRGPLLSDDARRELGVAAIAVERLAARQRATAAGEPVWRSVARPDLHVVGAAEGGQP